MPPPPADQYHFKLPLIHHLIRVSGDQTQIQDDADLPEIVLIRRQIRFPTVGRYTAARPEEAARFSSGDPGVPILPASIRQQSSRLPPDHRILGIVWIFVGVPG